MNGLQFQNLAQQYALFPLDNSGWDYILSALPEELGEFSAIFAKNARKGKGRLLTEDQRKQALSEIGDICWNLALACRLLGSDLSAVMNNNINKLEERKRANVIEGSGESVEARSGN